MSGCGSLAAGVGAELALEFPSTKGELRCPRGHSTPGMRDAEVGQDLKSKANAIGQSWVLLCIPRRSFCVSVIFIFPTSVSVTGVRTKSQLYVSSV